MQLARTPEGDENNKTVGILRNSCHGLERSSIRIYVHLMGYFSHKHQSQSSHRRQTDRGPSCHNDLLVRHGRTSIPDQMSNTVQAVVSKWVCRERLEEDLCEDGQAGETSGEGCALQMPAEQRCDEVCGAKGVDPDRERGACDTVEHRHVPCYLWPVDG